MDSRIFFLALVQAFAGISLFLGILTPKAASNDFFVRHAVVLAVGWLLLALFVQNDNAWLFGALCVVYGVAAINFKRSDFMWGPACVHVGTVLSAFGGMLSFATTPHSLPGWIQLWLLLSLFLGAMTIGLAYFIPVALFSSKVDDLAGRAVAEKFVQALILSLYTRGLYQAGTLIALPIADEKWEQQILSAVLHSSSSSTLVSLTWLFGLLLPILLIVVSPQNELHQPQLNKKQMVTLCLCGVASVWLGITVHI